MSEDANKTQESNEVLTQRQELRNNAYVRENLTPWEQKMLGEPEETPSEEAVETTEQKTEAPESTPKTDDSQEEKKDAKAILEKLLKGETEDSTEPKKEDAPKTKEKEQDDGDPLAKENRELKLKMQIIEESEKIEEILSNYSEKESGVLKDKLIELLGSPIYASLHKLPTEQKVASLITMARGLASDDIKAIAEESAETKSLLRDATSTPKSSNKEMDSEALRVKQLKEAARAGDRRAMVELQKYDPVLNTLAGN